MKNRVFEITVVSTALVALMRPAGAVVRHVPSQYATINNALDASSPGDSVLVAPGVYDQYETRLLGDGNWFSSVAFLKGGVALVSEAGASTTTLRMDATQAAPRVLRAFGQAGTTLVEGFTVTGTVPGIAGLSFTFSDRCIVRGCAFRDIGTGGASEFALGGTMSDIEIYGCRFENINDGTGSAISQTSGTLLVEDSEFLNCRQGAMRLERGDFPHDKSLTVRRCRFIGNVSNSGSGGISVGYPEVLIEDSWFDGNECVGTSPTAGAIATGGADANQVIRNCTFLNSSGAHGEGGALRLFGWTILVQGNTFFGNRVSLDWSPGGSAVFFLGGNAVFRENAIVANVGDQAVGVSGMNSIQTGCNVYWANPLGNTDGFVPDPTDLDADPLFCDVAAMDFHVSAASPCIPGNGHPSCAEQIGAWGVGCGTVAVESSSWSKIKSGFHQGSEEDKR